MNWQPIENAPKDGTVVDLWDGARFSDCHWSEDNERWQDVNHKRVYAKPTHFCIVTPPGEQQPESVNQRLLDALLSAKRFVTNLRVPQNIPDAALQIMQGEAVVGSIDAAIEAAKQATKV